MKTALHNYDIYPKVLREHKVSEITIEPLGRHVAFTENEEYKIVIFFMHETRQGAEDKEYPYVNVKPINGKLKFTYMFEDEQQVRLKIFNSMGKELVELSVYVLASDLYELSPYMGDLHVHTSHSDGKESPEIVAAYYRKAGFDFLAITDHHKYFPSLEAINAYKDASIDLKLFPGEEVHPPQNNTHVVNFGGSFSVNEIFDNHVEQYKKDVNDLIAKLNIPEGLNAFEYASCCLAYKKIQEGGGLAIFPHPHWISRSAYHVRQKMVDYLFETKPFDAFELIGGQSLEENLMQVAYYNDARAKGQIVPIVGSSDSHGVINAEWFKISKTVVLAKSNEKDDIINAIKDMKSAAIEQYAGEVNPRIYANFRLVTYIHFLIHEYFPIHDELCFEEGRIMKDYVNGVEGAKEALKRIQGRTRKLMDKYFGR